MDQDNAWKKADIVTIIAIILPRRTKGREDIASTTGIVEKGIMLPENGIVTGRAQGEGRPFFLGLIFRGRALYHKLRRP